MQKHIGCILPGVALLIIVFAGYLSQAQRSYSTITSFNYNKKKDRSEYMVLPFGSVSLPGKWKKGKYDKQSKQQWFSKTDDSLTLAILFAPCGSFEFNRDGSKSGFEFVKAYYDWEADYYTQSGEFKAALVEQDSAKGYRIMHLYGQTGGLTVNSYFLYAIRNCGVSNFYLGSAPKLQESEKVAFLKSLLMEE